MKAQDVIKIAAVGFGNLIVKPIVAGAAVTLGIELAEGIVNVKKKYKIQKGLKEGTIKEIGGLYYEVKEKPEDK